MRTSGRSAVGNDQVSAVSAAPQTPIFCEYNNRFGDAPSLAIAFLSPDVNDAAATKLAHVRGIGALEAAWEGDSHVPLTFFVEGYWNGDSYVSGFTDATGLPSALFEHLHEQYEGQDFEPVRFMLDTDPEALSQRLAQRCAFRAGTRMAEVIQADVLIVKREGAFLPAWEATDDDGKVRVLSLNLPVTGLELIERLCLDDLNDGDARASRP